MKWDHFCCSTSLCFSEKTGSVSMSSHFSSKTKQNKTDHTCSMSGAGCLSLWACLQPEVTWCDDYPLKTFNGARREDTQHIQRGLSFWLQVVIVVLFVQMWCSRFWKQHKSAVRKNTWKKKRWVINCKKEETTSSNANQGGRWDELNKLFLCNLGFNKRWSSYFCNSLWANGLH